MNSELTGATPAMTEPSALSQNDKHIVDVLIEERARHLLKRPRTWALIKRLIYPLLKYDTAIEMADAIADKDAAEVMAFVSQLLNVRLNVTGTENIPPTGRFMLTANHPTGIADGVAVYDALKPVRPDMCFFANRDAIRINPRLEEMIIPVEWVEATRTPAKMREMIRRMVRAFKEDSAIIMFPSGRLALPSWQGLREQDWYGTTVNLARRNNTPVLPLYMKGRNSLLYYFFHLTSPELRDMTLFNELLNKKNYLFHMTFGPVIEPHLLEGDPTEVAARLKSYVEDELSQDPQKPFTP